MEDQIRISVRWIDTSKRWLITLRAHTTEGPLYKTMVAETTEAVTPEGAVAVLEYVRMALESQYPF